MPGATWASIRSRVGTTPSPKSCWRSTAAAPLWARRWQRREPARLRGRSALLLGKAKDNNASCAIGPFIRLFDEHYAIDDVRKCDVALRVSGPTGSSSKARARSRRSAATRSTWWRKRSDRITPTGRLDAVPRHDVPGRPRTRHGPGQGSRTWWETSCGFRQPAVGQLVNQVVTTERRGAWTFGIGALMRSSPRGATLLTTRTPTRAFVVDKRGPTMRSRYSTVAAPSVRSRARTHAPRLKCSRRGCRAARCFDRCVAPASAPPPA